MQGWNANAGWANLLNAQRYQGQQMQQGIGALMKGVNQHRENKLYGEAGEIARNGTPEQQADFVARNMNNRELVKRFKAEVEARATKIRQAEYNAAFGSGDLKAMREQSNKNMFAPENEIFNKRVSGFKQEQEDALKDDFRQRLAIALGTKTEEDDRELLAEFAKYGWAIEDYQAQKPLSLYGGISTLDELAARNKIQSETFNNFGKGRSSNATAEGTELENEDNLRKLFPQTKMSLNEQSIAELAIADHRKNPTQENYARLFNTLNPLQQYHFTNYIGKKEDYSRQPTAKENAELAKLNAEVSEAEANARATAIENNKNRPLEEQISPQRFNELRNMLLGASDKKSPALMLKIYQSANTDAERKYIKDVWDNSPLLKQLTDLEKIQLDTAENKLEQEEVNLNTLNRNYTKNTPLNQLLPEQVRDNLAGQVRAAANNKDPVKALDTVRANNLFDTNRGKYITQLAEGINAFTAKKGESGLDRDLKIEQIKKERNLANKYKAETDKLVQQGIMTAEQQQTLQIYLNNNDYENALAEFGTKPAVVDAINKYMETKVKLDNPSLVDVDQSIQSMAQEFAREGNFPALRRMRLENTGVGSKRTQKATSDFLESLMTRAGQYPDMMDQAEYDLSREELSSTKAKRMLDRQGREDNALNTLNNVAEGDLLIDQILQDPAFQGATGADWQKWQKLFGLKDKTFQGTEAYDLLSKLDRLQTTQFLPAISLFKSAGAGSVLSDLEGQTLKVLFSNLDAAQSPGQVKKELETVRRYFHQTATMATAKLGRHAKQYPKGYRSLMDEKLNRLSQTNEEFYERGGLGFNQTTNLRQNRRELAAYPPQPILDDNGYAVDQEKNSIMLKNARQRREALIQEIKVRNEQIRQSQ